MYLCTLLNKNMMLPLHVKASMYTYPYACMLVSCAEYHANFTLPKLDVPCTFWTRLLQAWLYGFQLAMVWPWFTIWPLVPRSFGLKAIRLLILAFIRHKKVKTWPPLYILNTFTPGKAIWFSNSYGMALINHRILCHNLIWLQSNEAPHIILYVAQKGKNLTFQVKGHKYVWTK